jgi:hypothetical protein
VPYVPFALVANPLSVLRCRRVYRVNLLLLLVWVLLLANQVGPEFFPEKFGARITKNQKKQNLEKVRTLVHGGQPANGIQGKAPTMGASAGVGTIRLDNENSGGSPVTRIENEIGRTSVHSAQPVNGTQGKAPKKGAFAGVGVLRSDRKSLEVKRLFLSMVGGLVMLT